MTQQESDSANPSPTDHDIEASGASSTEAATPKAANSEDKPSPGGASFVFLLILTAINVVADLASKGWAKERLETARPGDREVVVIPDFMSFIYAENRGGAWGLLQGETESLRRPFFLIVSVAAIVFIVSLYRKLEPDQRALKWGLPLVLGGALGNLVDRIRYGYVVDFIDCYVEWGGRIEHWPTFNVADVSICVGVGLMAVDMFTSRPTEVSTQDGPAGAGADEASAPMGGDQAAQPAPPLLETDGMLVPDGGQVVPKPVAEVEGAASADDSVAGAGSDVPSPSTPPL